jgi:phosphohistidine phosphatase
MATARTLLVLRHAKAAGEPGVNDEQRPLTGRGRRDASSVGQWLLAEGIIPDRVLCSTSQRTRQTWDRMSEALGGAAPAPEAVGFERDIYDAGVQDLLGLIAIQPDEAGVLLTIGHNPASHQLAADLTGRHDFGFPTCALAVIGFGGRWVDAVPGSGDLTALWTPRSPV